MSKLTGAHIEQIKNMREDGKKGAEIIQFFKDTYNISLDASEISRAVHDKYSVGVASDERPRRRSAQRRYARKTMQSENHNHPKYHNHPKSSKDDFAMHVHEAFNIHKKDFIERVMGVLGDV